MQFELPDIFDEESFSTPYLMMQASTRSALSSMEWNSRVEESIFEHAKRALVYVYVDPIQDEMKELFKEIQKLIEESVDE